MSINLMTMNVEEFIKQHVYINYCEIIISPQGNIQYARPSHVEALIKVSNKRRTEINTLMSMRAAPISWLCEYTGYAVCWFDNFILPRQYTEEQKQAIVKLCDAGIMRHCIGCVTSEMSLCNKLDNSDFSDLEDYYSQNIVL